MAARALRVVEAYSGADSEDAVALSAALARAAGDQGDPETAEHCHRAVRPPEPA